jgi:hypothetical protein
MERDPVEEISKKYEKLSEDAFTVPDGWHGDANTIRKALESLRAVPGAVDGDLTRFRQEVDRELATPDLEERKSTAALDTGAKAIDGAWQSANTALAQFEKRVRASVFEEHIPQELRPDARQDAQLTLDAATDEELPRTFASLHEQALRGKDSGLARLLRSFWGAAYLRKRLGANLAGPALEEFRRRAIDQLGKLGNANEKAAVATLTRLPKMTAAATLAYHEADMRLAAVRSQQPVRHTNRRADGS